MPNRAQTKPRGKERTERRAADSPLRVRGELDAPLMIDPEFADKLRHVLYDRTACCPRCGYNLSGIEGNRCPECGKRLGDFLRIADTTPWRLPAQIRAAKIRRILQWLIAPIIGALLAMLAMGLALYVL